MTRGLSSLPDMLTGKVVEQHTMGKDIASSDFTQKDTPSGIIQKVNSTPREISSSPKLPAKDIMLKNRNTPIHGGKLHSKEHPYDDSKSSSKDQPSREVRKNPKAKCNGKATSNSTNRSKKAGREQSISS